MIRITKQTDYGIVLLTHLATTGERPCNAPELASEAQIPLPMVSKILKLLAHEGLLVSQRGVKGGYTLARPAEEISVAEIITVLEGPIAMTECIVFGPGECDQEAICPTRGPWHRINQAVREALSRISLAEMRQPQGAKAANAAKAAKAAKLVILGGREPLLHGGQLGG